MFRHLGYKGIPAVALASLAVNMFGAGFFSQSTPAGLTLLPGLALAGAHVVPYYLATRLMARYASTGSSRAEPRTAIAFLIISSLASLLAATLGITTLVVIESISISTAFAALLPWWIADFVALLALGPAGIALLSRVIGWLQLSAADLVPPDRYLHHADRSLQDFSLKLSICIAMILLAALLAALLPSYEPVAFLVFFAIIPQMWIVHVEGALRGIISIAINSAPGRDCNFAAVTARIARPAVWMSEFLPADALIKLVDRNGLDCCQKNASKSLRRASAILSNG